MMTYAEKLESFVAPGSMIRLGELTLSRTEQGEFTVRHKMDDDCAADTLKDLTTNESVEEMVNVTAEGEYRPLRTAPTLQCGWVATRATASDFLETLDVIYPGAVATWYSYHSGESDPTPLRDTLERQSGMNSKAKEITDQDANRIMRKVCGFGCLRKISWPIDSTCACSRIGPIRNRIPLICLEACTFAVEAARKAQAS